VGKFSADPDHGRRPADFNAANHHAVSVPGLRSQAFESIDRPFPISAARTMFIEHKAQRKAIHPDITIQTRRTRTNRYQELEKGRTVQTWLEGEESWTSSG